MRNKYFFTLSTVIFFCLLLAGSDIVHAAYCISIKDNTKNKSQFTEKITDTRSNKLSYLKNAFKVNFIAFNPSPDIFFRNDAEVSAKLINTGDDKILNNVKVYPNPISDLLNLTYRINKDANVSIKIMDVLGNEIATLLSERMPAGEQINSFNIASRLNSGFYFVRLKVGNETVIKRISVL